MPLLTGTYQTKNAQKYLTQLCKHFGHKVPAEVEGNIGHVRFVFGPTVLTATDTSLRADMTLDSVNTADLAKHVIDSHLKTFAFREEFEAMSWEDVKDDQSA